MLRRRLTSQIVSHIKYFLANIFFSSLKYFFATCYGGGWQLRTVSRTNWRTGTATGQSCGCYLRWPEQHHKINESFCEISLTRLLRGHGQGHLEIFIIVEHPLVEPVGGDCVDVDGGAAGPPPVGDVVDGGGTHLLRWCCWCCCCCCHNFTTAQVWCLHSISSLASHSGAARPSYGNTSSLMLNDQTDEVGCNLDKSTR